MTGTWKPAVWQAIRSIRTRIVLLVVVTVAPLVIERVRGLEVGRQDRLRLVSHQLVELARDGAERQSQMVVATGALLKMIAAAVPAIGDPDKGECRALLSKIPQPLPWLSGLLVALPDGQVVCATSQEVIGLDVADREYFRQTIAQKAPVTSDVLIGRATSTPLVITTFPILLNDRIDSVLFASIRLDWTQALIADRLATGDDIAAYVIDNSGQVMLRVPEPAGWNRGSAADHDVIRAVVNGQTSFTATDLDGKRRIFAAIDLAPSGAHLLIGLNENAVLANISRQIYFAYTILVVVTLTVLFAAWFGADRFIIRPIQALVKTASAVGHGDYAAGRARLSGPTEFDPLESAIRSMAERLHARESAMKETNQRLDRLAQFDALTGLGNRRSFDSHLAAEYAEAALSQEPLGLLMIDVDHFKQFNDRYGHVAGDACLQEIARAITNVVRHADFAARYGGEEFAVLGRGLTTNAALPVAERLRKAIRALGIPHEESPHRVVTISVGIASILPREGDQAERLVEEADAALYAAKKAGRDKIATGADIISLAS